MIEELSEETSEERLMKRAILIGERGRITAPPNPWVGCVIVKNGRIIGEGFHTKVGKAHAETVALSQASLIAGGMKAIEGSEAYISLEPCSHYGKTPPCVDALIQAKIAKIYIALLDPDPRVSGRGINALKEAGIEIVTGICRDEAFSSLEPYLHHRKTGLPYCVAKCAISLDGKIAAKDGTSKWITTEGARRDSHKIRAESQAIIVGSQTALKDCPRLTVRLENGKWDNSESEKFVRQPLKVVLDTQGRLYPGFDLVFTTSFNEAMNRGDSEMVKTNPEVIQVGKQNGGVNLKQVMQNLGRRGVLQVMVEGGALVLSSFMKESLIHRFVVYTGPCILGGSGVGLFKEISILTMAEAPCFELINVKEIDGCVRSTWSSAISSVSSD